jgi:hypothetical protein
MAQARSLVARLAERPHPVASGEQARVREFIADELRKSAVSVSEQTADAAVSMAGANQGAHLHNLLGTITGRAPNERAVMLVAHYDTAPNSRGAGDDGAAVAALLETARIISTGPRLRRTVHFLFTDAEEPGLLGALAFVGANPAAQGVGLVINFEARGTSGPVMMYQSSPHSGTLVAEYGRAVAFPHANSLVSQLSRLLPNDSDASVFINSGFPVLAFAFVEGLENYHRYTDSTENLDPRSLAHCATQALALARHFGELRVLPSASSDSVYFDVLARYLIHYPCWVATLLGTLCALGWYVLAQREIRSRRCSLRGIVRGAKLQLLLVGLALVLPIMLHLLRSLMLDAEELTRHSASYGFADLLVVAALNLLFHARAVRRDSSRDLVLGSLAIVVTLAAVLGWLVPQASAPWQWVSAVALVVVRFEPAIALRRPNLGIVCQQVPLAVAIALMAPVVSTGMTSAGPALMVIPLVLAASVMEFVFATLLPQARGLAPAAAGIGLLGFLVVLSVASWSCKAGKLVATASIVYAYDNDTNEALYAIQATQHSGWLGQWVPQQSTRCPLIAFTPSQALWRQARAPIYPQRVPEISVLERGVTGLHREVEVRVSPTTSVDCLKFWQAEGEPVRLVSVNSRPLAQFVRFSPQIDAIGLQLLSGMHERHVWKLDYCGLEQAPLVLRFHVPPGPPARLRAVGQARSLPKLMTVSKRPRPDTLVPGHESDATWIAQQIAL